jgi:hypothetical protein
MNPRTPWRDWPVVLPFLSYASAMMRRECAVSPKRKRLEGAIIFSLVGVIAEAKFYAPAIHRYSNGTYDFLVARMLIDELNALDEWPPMTYEGAAKLAVQFVEDRWQEIQNVALALADAGELGDFAVRTFARCGYDG